MYAFTGGMDFIFVVVLVVFFAAMHAMTFAWRD